MITRTFIAVSERKRLRVVFIPLDDTKVQTKQKRAYEASKGLRVDDPVKVKRVKAIGD